LLRVYQNIYSSCLYFIAILVVAVCFISSAEENELFLPCYQLVFFHPHHEV